MLTKFHATREIVTWEVSIVCGQRTLGIVYNTTHLAESPGLATVCEIPSQFDGRQALHLAH